MHPVLNISMKSLVDFDIMELLSTETLKNWFRVIVRSNPEVKGTGYRTKTHFLSVGDSCDVQTLIPGSLQLQFDWACAQNQFVNVPVRISKRRKFMVYFMKILCTVSV